MKKVGRAGDNSSSRIRELSVIRDFDPWKSPLCTCPPKYSLHPYTGCSHFCLYCYATSYIGLRDSSPKKDLLRKISRDLKVIDRDRVIELSSSSDPYPPIEKELGLTREALKLLISNDLWILVTTKSNLVSRDSDLLSKGRVSVMITITTINDKVARIIEPGAPSPGDRLTAIKELRRLGIPVGVRIDPIIPYVNDDPYEITELANRVVEYGALHVVTSTYKAKWDSLKRLENTLPPDISSKLVALYRSRGIKEHGYLYLPQEIRKTLLTRVMSEVLKHGITFATCREGFSDLNRAPSCDGSHLARYKNKAMYFD